MAKKKPKKKATKKKQDSSGAAAEKRLIAANKRRKKVNKKRAKTTGLKKWKPGTEKPEADPLKQIQPYGLHQKKLEIMEVVKVMPCSAVMRDKSGYIVAYTWASEVYQVYRQECAKFDLTIRRVEGHRYDAHRPEIIRKAGGAIEIISVPTVAYEGVWEIYDYKTGQAERFAGSGDGENDIWSNNSAQTVARKQALLDYFEVAWPQPRDYMKIIKEELAKLPKEKIYEAIASFLPKNILGKKTAQEAAEAIKASF